MTDRRPANSNVLSVQKAAALVTSLCVAAWAAIMFAFALSVFGDASAAAWAVALFFAHPATLAMVALVWFLFAIFFNGLRSGGNDDVR